MSLRFVIAIAASLARLSMNRFVIANEVKQSMTPVCMDRHATLAMTELGIFAVVLHQFCCDF